MNIATGMDIYGKSGHLPDPACAQEVSQAKSRRRTTSICLSVSHMLQAGCRTGCRASKGANQVKHTFAADSGLCVVSSLADPSTITTYLGPLQFGVQRRSALLEFKPG